MAQIHLKNVRKSYTKGVWVIHGVTTTIADGEFIVIVGPSGCGKSTLLRMIAGLETITDGTISIGERVVNDVEPKDRNIAMVFQNYALYPHMTVPPMAMVPSLISSRPAIMRSSVDLPQPDGPTRTQNSPSATLISMPWITSVGPKRLRTALSVTVAMRTAAQIRCADARHRPSRECSVAVSSCCDLLRLERDSKALFRLSPSS